METPSPPLKLDVPRRGHEAEAAERKPSFSDGSIERKLEAIVTEFDCSRTLQVGLALGDSAVAIAAVHERHGRGRHIAIDPQQKSDSSRDGLEGVRQAGLVHRLQFSTKPPEVALPELLRDGIEIDFALMHGPKRFDDAFLEFLYIDRILVTGGILIFAGAHEDAPAAVMEFIAQARAYELRSEAGSELAVLRKLGQQRTHEMLFRSRWSQPGERFGRGIARKNGAVPDSGAELHADVTHGAVSNGAPSRELHRARARINELKDRVAVLGACLLDAERRSAELRRTELELQQSWRELAQSRAEASELRAQLSLSEASHERAEQWLARLNSSASWRLTAPLRSIKKRVRAPLGQ